MIASSVPGSRGIVLLLVATVATAAWRTWPMAEDAPAAMRPDARPVTYRYVPLIGASLDEMVDDADGDYDDPPAEPPPGPVKTCLPFLAPVLEHPSWQLRIATGHESCVSDDVEGDFAIASTGEVTWTKPGWPVRHLALSSEQLALVQRLDRLSCVELQRQGARIGWLSIGLDLGALDRYAAARIPPESTLGRAVTAMLDDLTTQYRQPRREAIGPVDLRLATTAPGAIYQVRITGERLTVTHGRKLLVDEPVEADRIVDLADAALEGCAADEPDVRGALLLRGRSVPLALVRQQGPFDLIYRAIDNAEYAETQASSN